MVIVETSVFTRQALNLLTEDGYRKLQIALMNRPTTGAIIKGSGGLRKIRWFAQGRGKRGGARIIYYWAARHERLLMLFMYSKTERDDLTPAQIGTLRQIVREEYP